MRWPAWLLLALSPLGAQGSPKLSLPREDQEFRTHFQLRGSWPGAQLRDFAGSQVAGGAGFMMMFGRDPLRLQIRMDGDYYAGKASAQRVQTAGIGVEAVYWMPAWDFMTPYLSVGPAFQRWEIGGGDLPGQAPRSSNHLAGRFEAGVWFKGKVAASAGVLYGSFRQGKASANPYVALMLAF